MSLMTDEIIGMSAEPEKSNLRRSKERLGAVLGVRRGRGHLAMKVNGKRSRLAVTFQAHTEQLDTRTLTANKYGHAVVAGTWFVLLECLVLEGGCR